MYFKQFQVKNTVCQLLVSQREVCYCLKISADDNQGHEDSKWLFVMYFRCTSFFDISNPKEYVFVIHEDLGATLGNECVLKRYSYFAYMCQMCADLTLHFHFSMYDVKVMSFEGHGYKQYSGQLNDCFKERYWTMRVILIYAK